MLWVQNVDSQSVLMIETPHSLHTHTSSPSYNAIQHLLQWLVVTRMQHYVQSLSGPPPGFPQKGHFLCGTSTEKALREGPNIQRTYSKTKVENR